MGLFRSILYARKLTVIIVFITLCLIFVLIQRSVINDEQNDSFRKERIIEIDIEDTQKYLNLACKQPKLPVNSPELNKFLQVLPPIDCSDADIDWVICKNSECRISEYVKTQKRNVKCSFRDLIRIDDFNLFEAEAIYTYSYYKLQKSDVVKVSCKSGHETWSSVLTGVRLDRNIWKRTGWQHVPQDSLKLNVLMFGFDSISRNTFVRKLPISYKYLIEELNGLVLEGYNIVGDGTPQALTPMLTGATELELPDVRRRFRNTKYVNVYPFIWNDFKNFGYVTAYLEDSPEIGTYTYRLNGFNEPPTDHFMRSYFTAISKWMSNWPHLCAGSLPRHTVMMNYIKHFFSVYESKPKFLFGLHGELSHDNYNLIGTADEDLLLLLRDLYESGTLNNTLLILFADHGHRFAAIRNTIQGKQEERMPFFAFRFPPWFKNHHKKLYDNFVSNINKLTTPFDIHATLKSILHPNVPDIGNLKNRSISLFSKIPKERSCAHAGIEPHWCACLEWHNVDLSSPIIQELSSKFIDTINNYTSPQRDKCAFLEVAEIKWVLKLKANKNLVKFNKNADMDGFIPDLSSNMILKSHMYQIKVLLTPGESLFEASMTYYIGTGEIELNLNDVSRINKYGSQARCIMDSYPNLRKYCFCTVD